MNAQMMSNTNMPANMNQPNVANVPNVSSAPNVSTGPNVNVSNVNVPNVSLPSGVPTQMQSTGQINSMNQMNPMINLPMGRNQPANVMYQGSK